MKSGNQVRPAQSVDAVEADDGQDEAESTPGGAHACEGQSSRSRERADAGPKEGAKDNAKSPRTRRSTSLTIRKSPALRMHAPRSGHSMVSAAYTSRDSLSFKISKLIVEGGSSNR